MHDARSTAQASHHAPADAVILNALPPEIREEAPPEDEMQAARFLVVAEDSRAMWFFQVGRTT